MLVTELPHLPNYKKERKGFPGGAVVESPPAVQGTRVRAPVQVDPTCRRVAGPVSHDR